VDSAKPYAPEVLEARLAEFRRAINAA